MAAPLSPAQLALCETWSGLPSHVVHRWRSHPAVEVLGFEEALSVAGLALVKAAAGFDPKRGFAFTTYAMVSIQRNLVQASLLQSRTPRAWSLDAGDADGDSFAGQLPARPGPDAALGLDVARAVARLPRRLAFIVRHRYGLQGERQKTLAQVGALLGVSRNRVCQLEEQALARLRRSLVSASAC